MTETFSESSDSHNRGNHWISDFHESHVMPQAVPILHLSAR